jgi:hypothetical protein
MEFVLVARMGLIYLSDYIPIPEGWTNSVHTSTKPGISLPGTERQRNDREIDLQKPEIR